MSWSHFILSLQTHSESNNCFFYQLIWLCETNLISIYYIHFQNMHFLFIWLVNDNFNEFYFNFKYKLLITFNSSWWSLLRLKRSLLPLLSLPSVQMFITETALFSRLTFWKRQPGVRIIGKLPMSVVDKLADRPEDFRFKTKPSVLHHCSRFRM